MARPNVLYLHSHDTGRYLQPYGHAVPAPHFQQLAEQGVLFRQAFCAAPTCSPSRAALLTGQYAHSCGMLGLVNRGFQLEHPERHLANSLRQVGYGTTLIGVQHVVRDPATSGYEHIVAGRRAEQTTPAALDFLASRPQEPFFLDVGFTETHRVFREPGPAEDPRYCLPPLPLPDTPETRADMAAFKASARILDESVGAILEALERNGLAENTLVISTTDHGVAFPGMKCNLTDHGIGVSLIMRGPQGTPGGFAGGKVVDALVSQIDVFPTVCDIVGIERPNWLQGVSLLPLVEGAAEQVRADVFAEVNYHAAYEAQRAVRTARWKYIRRYVERDTPLLANCDDGLSKTLWLRHGWAERPVVAEQLYDLVFDPVETCNRAGDPACRDVLDALRTRLDAWMAETDDPLLRGPIALPEGGVVNAPDDRSPNDVRPVAR